MAAGYLLALREGLEAALIVGLLLGALRRTRHPEMQAAAWLGVGLAIALSLLLGVGLVLYGAELEGSAEAVFEGLMLTLAVTVLSWVVLWMQGQRAAAHVEDGILRAATAGQRWAVFLTAFLAVGREGLETGLFVAAAAFASETRLALLGAALGLLTAAILGAGLYFATLRLDIRRFFAVTSILLILFAAGLVSQAVHEFIELGWIRPGIAPVWDLSRSVGADSALGQVGAILLGYDPTPSLSQVIAYGGYLAGMAILVAARMRRPFIPARPSPIV
ncbi:MAG: FTR1 family protein [Anaerolineales bacterium]|nr:FTR1 family protein [Anaerolineales bacterium]